MTETYQARVDTVDEIVGQSGKGRRRYYVLAAVMGGIAVLSAVVTLAAPMIPRSLTYRAKKIMYRLPHDAAVAEVDGGTTETYGDVYFTVPEPKGERSRMNAIWIDQGLPAPTMTTHPVISPRVHSKAWSPLPPGSAPAIAVTKAKPTAKGSFAYGAPAPWYPPGMKVNKDMIVLDDGHIVTLLQYQSGSHRYHYQRTIKPVPTGEPDPTL